MGTSKRAASAAGSALSKLGASKGGRARAAKLSSEQRSEIAARGARARWSTGDDQHRDERPTAAHEEPEDRLVPIEMSESAWVDVHKAVVSFIRRNTGEGFQNLDQGHPTYAFGSEGRPPIGDFNDDEHKNDWYKLLRQTTPFAAASEERLTLVYNWQQFCKLVYTAFEDDMRRRVQE